MRLFIVRHGQTEWNTNGFAQGHSNVDLDETGRRQADRLIAALQDQRIQRVFSSDLNRCVETAQPLATSLDLELEIREDLRERTFGELEGAHYTAIRAWFSAESRQRGLGEHELRPEGGESMKDVWNRLARMNRMLDRARENTVIVTHGGTGGLLMARLMRGTVQTAKSFRLENASITELIRRPDGYWQMLRFSDTRHLSGCHEETRR
ncbi:MAG: histidine phosphatase family protein [Fimbriimonadaceae bacterium]|nr:MAG: histidine phosphatase family protein [Fimbriimonadaceae bacterium]